MRGYSDRTKQALLFFVARTWTGGPSVSMVPFFSASASNAASKKHWGVVSAFGSATLAFPGTGGIARGRLFPGSKSRIIIKARTGTPNSDRGYGCGCGYSYHSFAPTPSLLFLAKPQKAGSVVDNYQTVSVNCNTCRERLFRYKKKNGTKSNLVKCYVERISDDCAGILARAASLSMSVSMSEASSEGAANHDANGYDRKGKPKRHGKRQRTQPSDPPAEKATVPTSLDPEYSWECPKCHTRFARSSLIHGRPALKMIGGKIRMTKK